MIQQLGKVRPGSTLRIPFNSFDKDDGSAITMTNFAVGDILIYKDGGTTERASTTGFTATTDFDAKTGKHLAIIDLADNTTAGFFTAGSEYVVAIDAVTVDAVTVGGWIARFTIGYDGSMFDTSIASLASQTSFTLTLGPAEDDALNGCTVLIHDIASAVQCGLGIVLDYTGSTKTVTLVAGTTFTVASGDNISVMFPHPLQATVMGRTLDVAATGEAGLDFDNLNAATTAKTPYTKGVTYANDNGNGFTVSSTGGNGHGLSASGNGTGEGISATGGVTGNGAEFIGGATSGNGITARASTSGTGMTATGVGTSKSGFEAAGGATSSDGILATGGGTGQGISAQSGSGATGDGIQAKANSTNGMGIRATGSGTGNGLLIQAGATGNGLQCNGGGTSGSGADFVAGTLGHGAKFRGSGTGDDNACGIRASGGGTGANDGFRAVAGTGGVPIRGDITGSITGNLSGSVGSVTGAVGSVTGSVGSVTGAVGSVTGLTAANLDTTVSSRASQTSVDTIDDFLDTEVAAILAAVDTEMAAVLALLDNARTEPGQGAPPVNPDMATKVDYLYKAWRNKKDNDGATTNLYADDGVTIDHKQTTVSAGGTVTKGEWATGA